MTSPPLAPRPSPRPAFLKGERRPVVYFCTSNTDKFLQAREVFGRFGLALLQFKTPQEPYDEDYSGSKERLLCKAIDSVVGQVGRANLVFVEDTSVRINVLSTSQHDVPGLRIKEWFKATSFAEADSQLRSAGSDRTAVIHSGIALHVPGLEDPVLFEGQVSGTMALTPPTFEPNQFYPWLTPNTFNGWFIPEGSTLRLGEMPFDTSWRYDFRVRALVNLVHRLEEYAAVLNAPSRCYSVRQAPTETSLTLPLFPATRTRRPVQILVVGRTCAGKTTFGEYAKRQHPSVPVVEASDVVRSFRRAVHSDLGSFDFARRLLTENGPDIVARRAADLYQLDANSSFIVTGFRTIEEVEFMRTIAPNCVTVHVDSSLRDRFGRHLARQRETRMNEAEFAQRDAQQWSLGLLRVANDVADIKIDNSGLLEDYERQVLAVLDSPHNPQCRGVVQVDFSPLQLRKHRLFRILKALSDIGRPMSSQQLAAHIKDNAPGEGGARETIRPNNINKVLRENPELAVRYEGGPPPIRYGLTPAGLAYLRFMESRLNTATTDIDHRSESD